MRVLVAEGGALRCAMLRDALLTMGHECLVATDGDEAWRQFQAFSPDVIISDRLVPGIDGLELCRRVREEPGAPYTYFILLMALSDKAAILQGIRGGADDYLSQPLDLDELCARLIVAERVTALHRRLGEQAHALEQSNRQLFEMARTDPLTGLGNRLQMQETLAMLQARAERYGNSYALALCDLDRFKGYNDTLGHAAGDAVLRRVAEILTQTTRDTDSVYRYGGEEILIVLPEQTLASAELAGERIRRAVAAASIAHPANQPYGIVTVSIGITAFDQGEGDSLDAMIAEADAALYEAKVGGRNRVAIARTPVSA